ncbi:hypothetical protein TRFO_07605 [Tritrichomonas foetus]|uniref:Sec1 family protein n=1 Tax=Tritrichomonas foetus TaxID=1144522 RepID=A0A1J4JV14_9EUKA|nr:hypothetical protein TRFO_07605 [Tritrichomonas foetus]|eukprot:OHT01364.1 hypothetical protein TRFO_07605 [Tritrichomonas foetus]
MTVDFYSRLENVAASALSNLHEQFPDVYFYFVEPEYWSYFYNISQKSNLKVHIIDVMAEIPISPRTSSQTPQDFLDPKDKVLYIGRPFSLLQICKTQVVMKRQNPIIFVSIPVYSYSLKIEVWKQPINFTSFSSLCFPFIPFRHYLQLAVGSFKKIFMTEPVYEEKAIKAALSSLMFIFGRFDRVYAVGHFSSSIAKGFLDCHDVQIQPGQNVLVLMDRTVDLLSIIRIHDSYINFLEELGCWNPNEDKMNPTALGKMLGKDPASASKLPIFSDQDDAFETLATQPLHDAMRRVNLTDIKNSKVENLAKYHTTVMQKISEFIVQGYLLDLVLKIQRRLVDPIKYGRCVPLSPDGPSLAFRMLSILHFYGMNDEAKSIGRLLAAKFGLPMFSRWNQLDEIAMKSARIDPPPQIKSINPILSSIVSLFGHIVADTWKRPNFPVHESYLSTQTALPDGKHRWFVGVIGGMSSTELRLFKKVAKICRPDDEFIFMSTGIVSARQFMKDIIQA